MADDPKGKPLQRPTLPYVTFSMTLRKTGLAAEFTWEAEITEMKWLGGTLKADTSRTWPYTGCGATPQKAAADAIRWYVTDRIVE